MWNPLRTLRERDAARLRTLEKDFELLASDVETCLNAIPKIHAKLRMRATRAAAAEIESEETSVASSSATQSPSDLQLSLGVSPSKEAVRDLARRRGFLNPRLQRRQQEGGQ